MMYLPEDYAAYADKIVEFEESLIIHVMMPILNPSKLSLRLQDMVARLCTTYPQLQSMSDPSVLQVLAINQANI